jgi:ABC-type multidrug transport system fused ATPase/permease subunit
MKSPKAGFLSSGPVYELLALLLPLSLLTAITFLIGVVLPGVLPSGSVIASGCFAGLAASVYDDLFRDMKTSRLSASIRGLIAITALAYLISSLARFSLPMNARFVPSIANIVPALAASSEWGIVILFKKVFRARKHFEAYAEQYRGERLQRVLAEDPAMVNSFLEKTAELRRAYLLQLIIIAFLTAIAFSAASESAVPLSLLLLAIVTSSVCMFGFMALMKQEYSFAAEGIALSAALRFRQIMGMLLFAILALIIALIAASDQSLLSPSIVAAFFAWLLGLLRRLFSRPSAPLALPRIMEIPEEPPAPLFSPLEGMVASTPWIGWKYVQYFFIALLIAALLLFMIRPLFNRTLLRFRWLRNIRDLFSEWFEGLKDAARDFLFLLRSFKHGKAVSMGGKGAEGLRGMSEEVFAAYVPVKKLRQSVGLFAQLIIWGTRYVAWKPSHAPGEYCALLADALGGSAAVIRCGALFERALYAPDEPTAAEQAEFGELVMKLVEGG